MKIILKEDIKKVGHMGDEVSVANGYARNFLLPRGKALLSNNQNLSMVNRLKRLRAQKIEKIKQGALDLAEKIKKATCQFSKKAGEQDKLFGSVTTQDIVKKLKDQNIEIDKKYITLNSPVKSLGEYTATVKLHHEVSVDLSITVVKEIE